MKEYKIYYKDLYEPNKSKLIGVSINKDNVFIELSNYLSKSKDSATYGKNLIINTIKNAGYFSTSDGYYVMKVKGD